jgi:hypothetical protein
MYLVILHQIRPLRNISFHFLLIIPKLRAAGDLSSLLKFLVNKQIDRPHKFSSKINQLNFSGRRVEWVHPSSTPSADEPHCSIFDIS